MSIPSRKSLVEYAVRARTKIDPELAAYLARSAMEWAESGDLKPKFVEWYEDYFQDKATYPQRIESVRAYVDRVDRALRILDYIFDGFGIEYLEPKNENWNRPRGILYVNQGDTYSETILYDLVSQSWSLGTYGDRVERGRGRF